jgi:hypothetical protein
MPTNISTLTHLFCDILSRLVALDEGDGLLNLQTFFRPVAKEYEGTNGPLIIAVALSGGFLGFLVSGWASSSLGSSDMFSNLWDKMQVRHTLIRVLGTCLVISYLEPKQPSTTGSDSESAVPSTKATPSTSVFSLLRRTKLLRSRIRRSISYALLYSLASGLCNWLASSISDSYLWLAFAEIVTVVLLERLHIRWTHSILSRAPRELAYNWRSLLLPTVIYALTQKLVAEAPALIGTQFAGTGDATSSVDTVAARDVAVLISAFTLRFSVLYPAWASLIAFETRQMSLSDITKGQQQSYAYGHVLKLCYRKVLLRLASLHLQAAGLMIGIELGVYVVLHFLLRVPPTLPPQT